MKSYGDEAADLHNKEMPKVASNHTVISVDSSHKKDKKLLSASVFKRM